MREYKGSIATVYMAKCQYCWKRYIVEDNDLIEETNSYVIQTEHKLYYCRCPECGAILDVEEKKVLE